MASYDRLNFPQRVVRGDTWTFQYTIEQLVDGVATPVDITTWSFEGWVANTRESTTTVPMTATVIDGPAGTVRFTLDETVTNTLSLGSLYYQIRYTVGGDRTTLFRGVYMVL